jgi:hypothetical protein
MMIYLDSSNEYDQLLRSSLPGLTWIYPGQWPFAASLSDCQ